ncbi:hypothetical protein CU097_015801 [Rhizopus azygosporus]|uniref:Uncharacterized protein n=1 Tax=Rhizopus azygosporus TaxID=86630 RepID=A0A367KFG5_RHIAZ|nr:hypothetical protein CU097_015801 [Rhizopus azygosporus]
MAKRPFVSTSLFHFHEAEDTQQQDYVSSLRSKLNEKLSKRIAKGHQPIELPIEKTVTSTLYSIVGTLLNKPTSTSEELELYKIFLSSTVSFASPKIFSVFENSLSPNWFQQAKHLSEASQRSI